MTYLNDDQVGQLLRQTWVRPDGCVLWTGCTNPAGYGVIKIGGRKGKTFLTHRLSYAIFVGELIPGLQIDHLCKVPPCLAPTHLEQVTAKVNTQRSDAGWNLERLAAITHCPQGHPYDETNTYRPPNAGYAHRMCRTCMRRRWHEWDAKRKGLVSA